MDRSNWLYHRVPDPMAGHILYPLNRLASVYPEVASAHKKKYDSREHLMQIQLPILDCLWNDVLHFSPVHPTKIKEALMETGCLQEPARSHRFFLIDPRTLASGEALFWRNSKDTKGKYDFMKNDFAAFEPTRYRELEDIPEEQRTYFAHMKSEGTRPLLWARTPHVFYRGEIDVRGLKAIQW